MAWWNNLAIADRRYWLLVTKGGSVAECWEAYKARCEGTDAKGTEVSRA
jgi:hypothetical protein